MKGENNPLFGKHHSEESRKKTSEANKGNTKAKGKFWFNNGIINIRSKECPEGFAKGRIKK